MEELTQYSDSYLTAGCDEAGRGCLAGPVFAAAVIFPSGYRHLGIRDSKTLQEKQRYNLAEEIKRGALAWGIARVDAEEIDRINILQASILAMHKALDLLSVEPAVILVDGNRFKAYRQIPSICIVKGDGRFLEIAAAGILAKTARDDHMKLLHKEYPCYQWDRNKGYPAAAHIRAIMQNGRCPYHRRSFRIKSQLSLIFK